MRHNYFVLTLILIGIALNFLCLDNYHNWGDDFSLYINQSKAIVHGDYGQLLAVNTDMMKHGKIGPFLYPIGYPLMIAPINMLHNAPLVYFKYFNLAIFLCGLFYFYKILSLLESSETVKQFTVISLLFSPIFIDSHNQVLSDTTSFTFIILALYAFIRYLKRAHGLSSLLTTSIFCFIACTVRTTNIIVPFVFIAIILYRRFKEKTHFPKAIKESLVILTPTMLLFVANIWLPINRGSNELETLLTANVFRSVAKNSIYYVTTISSVYTDTLAYFIGKTFMSLKLASFFPYRVSVAQCIILPLFIPMVFKFFKKAKGIQYLFIAVILVCIGTLAIYLIWPFRQGPRFILVLYPFVLYFTYKFISMYINKGRLALMLVVIALVTYNGIVSFAGLFQRKSYNASMEMASVPGSRSHTAMMQYIRDSVEMPNTQKIGANKPRLLYLMTAKPAYTLTLKNLGYLKYVFIRQGTDVDDYFVAKNQSVLVLNKQYGLLKLYEVSR